MKKTWFTAMLFLLTLIVLGGCAAPGGTAEPTSAPAAQESTAEPEDASGASDNPIVEITMEGGGIIRLELDPSQAPLTVENFLSLVEDGFYDGLTFHRISKGFVIQGGDPLGNGTGGPGHSITGEFLSNDWNNTLAHDRGVISMARSKDPDSAGSQFFIVLEAANFLNGEYAAFGHVIEGMDVVDEIAAVPTNGETPLTPVVMETVRVVE